MAEGGFFAKLFGFDDENQERINSEAEPNITETTETTLQSVVNFVAELQSYFYNDICKMQTDLVVNTGMSQSEINFINKKIKQDQVALRQIDEILELVKQSEREYQSVWKKSVYSFYNEIEDAKLETVQKKVLPILLRLLEVNTKPELERVILDRIKLYKQEWKIEGELKIPQNSNAIIVDWDEGIEKYRFGNFQKLVYAKESEKVLSPRQLDNIRGLEFEFEFEYEIHTDYVWVYSSAVTRFQLNFMRRTCFIKNDWEYNPDKQDSLMFDIVKKSDLEQYLKGILQILLTRKTYAVISIVIPTNDMLSVIGATSQEGDKVEICKKYRFYLKERSGLYKDNLFTTRIDRRDIPEKLQFISFSNFRKEYF